ncbi:ABC transporter substrate-binding protein [Alkaliphilus peptidifermentans]|uniref:Peptide/nickel transport system substrate-binding protein n=1 Tax=Alkaliphilus peptidifermentans DSM 18978 TaxID=1120976 RepID=A0A1G5BIY6_9FIRM|nr:ABC transporter substrate-binding protein [Alkaliphilus peptidifermentans]SCX90099.1 peptide/nickel transport system substrate-binding protein [Alkaliphilus peptidifermentans DSM 18978]
MKRKLSLLLCFVLVAAVFLTACGGGTTTEAPEAPEGQGGETQPPQVAEDNPFYSEYVTFIRGAGNPNNPATRRGDASNTIVIGMQNGNDEFLPVYYSSVYDGYVSKATFDGLLTNNAAGEYIPEIAESWKISEDGRTYTFKLREDVYFHDGVQLTSKDVAFTFTIYADPGYTGRYYTSVGAFLQGYEDYKEGDAETLEAINIIDDFNISITFKEKMANHYGRLIYGIMPEHYYGGFEKGNADAALKPKQQDLMGSGPYQFVRHEPTQFTEFKRFDEYIKGTPPTERIIYRYTSADTYMMELEAGSIDIQLQVNANADNMAQIEPMGFIDIVSFPANSYQYMGFNMRNEILGDKNVRHALTYGLNRQQFVDVFFTGYGNVATMPFSQVSWVNTDRVAREVNRYEYSQEKAIELLEASGWMPGADGIREKDGKKLSFVWDVATDSQYYETLIPMLIADWKKIGVDVRPNLMDFGALVDHIYKGREFDVYTMGWRMVIDPGAGRTTFHTAGDVIDGNNSIGYNNPRVNELYDLGDKEMDFDKRVAIYEEIALLINEDAPYIFLTQQANWDVVNQRIKGMDLSPYVEIPYVLHQLEIVQ